jgi:hypothetical protein
MKNKIKESDYVLTKEEREALLAANYFSKDKWFSKTKGY